MSLIDLPLCVLDNMKWLQIIKEGKKTGFIELHHAKSDLIEYGTHV